MVIEKYPHSQDLGSIVHKKILFLQNGLKERVFSDGVLARA